MFLFPFIKTKKRMYINIDIDNTFGHTAIAKLILNAICNLFNE